MNIPVKVVEGCEVTVIPDIRKWRQYRGIIEKVLSISTFTVLVDKKSRNIHISQIASFTFGGVWMINHKFCGPTKII